MVGWTSLSACLRHSSILQFDPAAGQAMRPEIDLGCATGGFQKKYPNKIPDL
jgi:hypothetical protein